MQEAWFKSLVERPFRLTAVLLLATAAFLAYANTFTGEFVWDDASSVLLHKHVQDPSKFFQLFREDQHAFGRGQGNFYRPLVSASFMLDFALSKPAAGEELSPFLFHLTNAAWHAAAAILLFALLARVGAPRFVQLAASAVYVVHPLHTEAVAYISGRADMMSAAFMYAGLYVAARDRAGWGGSILAALLAGLCFICGLLSKEAAFIFPLLAGLLIFRPVEGVDRKAAVYARRSAVFVLSLAILGVYAVLRSTVLHFGTQTTPETGLGERVVELLQAYALYLRLLIVPTGLHMERTLDGVGAATAVAGAVLLAVTVALAVFSWRRGQRRAAMGLVWFLITWLPISGLFPLNAPMAEHWMYLPMAGLLWAVAELAWAFAQKPAPRYAVVAAAYGLGVVFLALTVARNRDWHDNESIFLATLDKNPDSTRVRYNLAVTYEDLLHNPWAARRQYEGVIASYREQKRGMLGGGKEEFWDEELESHLSLGGIYADRRQYGDAAAHFSTVMRVAPTESNGPVRATAAFGLGQCFLATGDSRKALELFKQAAAGRPDLKGEIERLLAGQP